MAGDELWRQRWTLDYAASPRLSLGIEVNKDGKEVLPRGTWFLLPEERDLPSVTLGVTADRLSTSKGHAVFLTWSKSMPSGIGQVFVSQKYSTDNRRLYFPFGGNVNLSRDLVFQSIYDGDYTHLLLTYHGDGRSVSAILGRTRYWGIQVSVNF